MTADLSLTPRERQILRAIAAGYSSKQIAADLNTSVRTVEAQRLTLRRKTGTGARHELVELARRLGLDVPAAAEPYAQGHA